jgi:high-affinity Fe2+/Pb2+ permease
MNRGESMAEDREVAVVMKEFVGALMTYLRQQGAEFMTGALMFAAVVAIVIGLVFFSNFMVLGFARLFDALYWGYLSAAVIMFIIGLVLFKVMRGGKAEEEARHGKEGDDGNG